MKVLLAVDGNSIGSRAYYTGNLLNFFSMIEKAARVTNPTHFIVAFDDPDKKSHRYQIYPDYKKDRDTQDGRYLAMSIFRETAKQLDVPHILAPEADDALYSLTLQKQYFDKIVVLSGDKDMYALPNDRVYLIGFTRSQGGFIQEDITPEKVYKKLSVHPWQITDYKALVGDKSDNIPGCKGIGPKGASSLLQEYTNLDNILASIFDLRSIYRDKIMQYKDDILLSRQLAAFYEVPVPIARECKTPDVATMVKWVGDVARKKEMVGQ